jgi:two-component system nitrate/nitrite response regulator NarL
MDRKLSPREIQILNCLKEGAPNKAIARKLDITEATIKVHVKAILRKIGASNRTQAAMWASKRLPRQGASTLDV